eukprot:gene38604-47676_t
MAGKWHLGHAQHKMTPIGHGFDSFVGNFMWDVDYRSKQLFEAPWNPLAIDWIREYANGTYTHYAEPRHSTEAITEAAEDAIRDHVEFESQYDEEDREPLFLYVAYTAPHSPLQPRPEDVKRCEHISQEWRRKYCGLVVGLDEGIRNITSTALSLLGENTLMIVASDNGAVPWFGGMNAPLRGSKSTPYEGGVRVPALIVDFTAEQDYFGTQPLLDLSQSANSTTPHRIFNGLMHSSDWLPTLLSYAQIPSENWPEGLDGFDFSDALRDVTYTITPSSFNETSSAVIYSAHSDDNHHNTASPRSEALLEMYYAEDSVFGEELQAYRYGDFKYIQGIVRDEHSYRESTNRWLNISQPSLVTTLLQIAVPTLEALFGAGPMDAMRLSLTHVTMQGMFTQDQKSGKVPTLRLFNLVEDPLETHNLASLPQHSELIALIQSKLEVIKASRPVQQKVWMQFHLFEVWARTHVKGDCSMNPNIREKDCVFTHSWIPDDVDPFSSPGILSLTEYTHQRGEGVRFGVLKTLCIALGVFVVVKRVDLGDW